MPLVTAGFYSKDAILWQTWASTQGSRWLWAAGVVGVLLTAMYSFRVVFRVFFGRLTTPVDARPGWRMRVALLILALLSIGGGWLEVPETIGHLWPAFSRTFGHLTLVTNVLHTALPATRLVPTNIDTELAMQMVTGAVSLLGILLAAVLFLRRPRVLPETAQPVWWLPVYRLWLVGWGFDWLYNTALVRPINWLAQANKADVLDAVYNGTARLSQYANRLLSQT